MRFGIEMNTDHTLEEVGKQFDVTRERIWSSIFVAKIKDYSSHFLPHDLEHVSGNSIFRFGRQHF